MVSQRYLVIHGHFYQPPRENPWMLAIEPQESAAPFADWNLRIDRECYAPNCRSRLMAADGRIARLLNNYRRLSFNFGPTLLRWLAKADPDTYAQIIRADREAAQAQDGHGPALAQVYNHLIMPLANERDRQTQIRWGLADFETRFGRRPEGLWLAETAADLGTLKLLAREGLKFTILAQGQAAAVRPRPTPGAPEPPWCDVAGGRVDPREPYRVVWGPGPGDGIDVFFYDGPVSRSIAFEKLLSNGEGLLQRVEQAFGQPRADGGPRLVNLATDGESYGHHFVFGDMALSWLFDHLEKSANNPEAIRLTNYGQYLAWFPPAREVKIFDNTSWSCAHGVERWRSDCGCNTGGGGGTWNQKWRAPLRGGLNWLRDRLADIFQTEGAAYLKDPWAARDEYIRVIIADYDEDVRGRFLEAHQVRPLSPDETSRALALLEAQLMGLYMFTSCGWFFDDISGLEPVQNLRYALRAIELAGDGGAGEAELTRGLMSYLETIRPNDPEYASGRDIWKELVAPDSLGGRALAAHWAAAEILDVPEMLDGFLTPTFREVKKVRLDRQDLTVLAGLVDLYHRPLARCERLLTLAVYSGGTHLAFLVDEAGNEIPAWMDRDRLSDLLGPDLQPPAPLKIWERLVQIRPGAGRSTLEDLLPWSRSRLLRTLVKDVYEDIKDHSREMFVRHQHLLMMNRSVGQSITWMERFLFRVMGEAELKRLLGPADRGRPINLVALGNLLHRRGLVGLAKDEPTLSGPARDYLQKALRGLAAIESAAPPRRLLTEILGFLKLITDDGYNLDLWESQNQWYDLKTDPAWTARLTAEEADLMRRLGLALGFSGQGAAV